MTLSLLFVTWAFLSLDNSQPGPRASLWFGAAIGIILLLFLFTASDWFDKYTAGSMFNSSEFAVIWSILPLAVGLVGFSAVAFRFDRIVDAPLKCLFFFLIILGNGWDSWQFANSELTGSLTGSYLGGARWSYLAGLALAPVVIHRLIVGSLDRLLLEAESASARDIVDASDSTQDSQAPANPARTDTSTAALDNSQLLKAMDMMMNRGEEAGRPQQIIAAVVELLDAEVCLLLRMNDAAYATVIASLDNVKNQAMNGITLSLAKHPTFVDAARRREQRSLAADTQPEEVTALFHALKIGGGGAFTIQPIAYEDKVLAMLLVALPYRQAELNPDQRALLGEIGKMAGIILAWRDETSADPTMAQEWSEKSRAAEIDAQEEYGKMNDNTRDEKAQPVDSDNSAELREQLKQLKADHDSLLNQREEMRREYQALLQRFETRGADNRALKTRIGNLQRQLELGAARRSELERKISELSSERDNLLRIRDQLTARLSVALADNADESAEMQLRARLQELQGTVSRLNDQREQLRLELGEAENALAAANKEHAQPADPSAAEAYRQLAKYQPALELVREMGMPIAAISDCAEILLQESLGILGAAQLKVVQRVAANLSQLTTLLARLLRSGYDENEELVLTYAEIDIVDLLDETITALSADIRKKRLALELSVGDGIPQVRADSNCIKQVLRHLLQNACDVSGQGAPILVSAALLTKPAPVTGRATAGQTIAGRPAEVIRISVADNGGGISSEDLPRVFARKYLRENPKIEGLSDTGVGMTVARAFARAHAGDLWIASEAGMGCVFHFELPVELPVDLPARPMPSVGK